MGLRCLLGHDFDEPELQREREEDGDEVVTTVREVKTCARCGETQVVSENTEVTTMQQLADEAAASRAGESDPGGPAGPATAPDAAEEPASAAGRAEPDDAAQESVTLDEEPSAGADDAVILDDGAAADADDGGPGATPGDAGASAVDDSPETAGSEPSEEDAELLDAGNGAAAGGEAGGGEAGAGEAPATDAVSDDEPDAETDDGVILDADDDESAGDRERGAWPEVDADDADGDGAAAWPDHGGEDEGFSAEVGEGGDAGVEFGGGLTPETAEQEEADGETEYVEAPDDSEGVTFDANGEGGTGITRSESPELQTAGSDEPTEYYCPECGMVRASDGSSMRAGDICPECKRGYVDERPR